MAKASPIPLLGIDHVVIRVRDLQPMLAFYTDVLGCEVAKHNAQWIFGTCARVVP